MQDFNSQQITIAFNCIKAELNNTIATLEAERATKRGHAKGMVTKQINKCITAQIIVEQMEALNSSDSLDKALRQAQKAMGYYGCFLPNTIEEAIKQASEQAPVQVLELNCGTNVGNKKDRILTADVMEAIDYLAAGTVFLSDKIFLDSDENTVYLRFEWPSIGCTEASLKRLADSLCAMLGQAAIPLRCLDNGLAVMGICEANKPSVWREEWEEFNIEFFQVPHNIDLIAA